MTNPADDLGPTTAWPPSMTPTTGVDVETATDDQSAGRYDPSSTTGAVASDQAAQVKDTATGAAQDVASTVKDQTRNVVGEAQDQARGLLDQAKREASSQAGAQQQRAAGLLGDYASELQALASGEQTSGPITDLARRGGDKAQEFSTWLGEHEPADLLDEVRAFARRRPAAFLIGAALAGVVVGRATRGFASNAKADRSDQSDARPAAAQGSSQVDPYGYDEALAYEPAEPVLRTPTGATGRDDVIR